MISVIICSRHSQCNCTLFRNITDTIGAEFELVWIDNSHNEYSMCSAYNEGVRRAKGEYLCFMHEDITFLSKDWGKIAVQELSLENVGMVGIIGSTYYDRSMCYWCHTPFSVGHNWVNDNHRIFSEDIEPADVVTIDGLWMFSKRNIFDNIKWDEKSFRKFDMYDMDISMQILKLGKKIRIISDIHVDHKSNGNYSSSFYEACEIFHSKWDEFLPVSSKFPLAYCLEMQMSYTMKKFSEMDIYTQNLLKISFVKIALIVNRGYHRIKKIFLQH